MRSLDEAMQEFLDEYGTQFLRLEGPGIDGKWYADVIASGIEGARGVADSPAEAILMAVAEAKRQEVREPHSGGKGSDG